MPDVSARVPAGRTGRILLKALLYWLPLALSISVLAAFVHVAVQQNFRQNANDPQIQMAEDAATQLENGLQPQAVVGSATVDMAKSLAPFLIVYDEAGQPVASGAVLNGQTPSPPPGVFSSVSESGEDRISWQPQAGVRSAAVITHFGGGHPGFVLAGRSLREVEDRESQLTLETAGAWLVAMAGSLVAWVVVLALADRLFADRGR